MTLLPLLVSTQGACGDGSDPEGDDDGATGSNQGSVGAGGGGSSGQPGACFEAFPGSWSLQVTSGPSQCNGFAPIECDVSQQACTVIIESAHLGGTVSVAIDADGKTESAQVPIGDGIVADCHAEFAESFGTSVGDVFSMTLVCSAMGAQCEFGESKIFTDD